MDKINKQSYPSIEQIGNKLANNPPKAKGQPANQNKISFNDVLLDKQKTVEEQTSTLTKQASAFTRQTPTPTRQTPTLTKQTSIYNKQKSAFLRFSKHANERLLSRNIDLTNEQVERLNAGARMAGEKGIRESLIMVDDLAFIVSVRNNMVITAVGDEDDRIFTNIDGAVIS